MEDKWATMDNDKLMMLAALETLHGDKDCCWTCTRSNRNCIHRVKNRMHILCNVHCAWPEVGFGHGCQDFFRRFRND